MGYLVNLLTRFIIDTCVFCTWKKGPGREKVQETSSFGRGPGGRAAGAVARRGRAGFGASGLFNAVITTFITHEFNRGPWTSAVQGPKNINYFLGPTWGQWDNRKSSSFYRLSILFY